MEITFERRGNDWVFSDGTILPVVSGSSDTGPLVLPPEQTGGDEGGEETPPETLAGDFLKNIPDEDKAVVEKYIKEWDGNVTKKFQEIHGQYEPYKQLGNLEEVQAAIKLRELFDNDPEYVYSMLAQEFGKQEGTGVGGQQQQTPELPAEFQGLPEPFVKQYQEQQKMLENLAQIVITNQQQSRESEEDKALENELSRLKGKYGEFDEEFVLSKMWHGSSGDDAVKAYQTLIQNIKNGQEKPKPQPPGLFGGGQIPTDKPDLGKMEGKEVRNLVADIISKVHQEG